MAISTPDSAAEVENRMKADVQRSAPDSNPYLSVHWLRSLIAAIALRIYDFYRDLTSATNDLFPDTAAADFATRWGAIYGITQNPASGSSGRVSATGTPGSAIPIGTLLAAGDIEYATTAAAVVASQVLVITSITRSGTTATATTVNDHLLSSFALVTIVGADQSEYNIVNATITVIGPDTFTYEVAGSPVTPATGTITAEFIAASCPVVSNSAGADTNQAQDTTLTLQTPLTGINSKFHVDNGTLGGGTDEESLADFRTRYIDRIQNPVAHYNVNDLIAKAKEVPGVTRVWVLEAGDSVGTVAVASITRSGNVATVTTVVSHGLDDGATETIIGAGETEYNVTDARVIVESDSIFHYVVSGNPATPATGVISAAGKVALGQTNIYFMRDNDDDPIPTTSEVATVKAALDTIRPANTSTADLIVEAPTANVTDYVFSELVPNTSTMQAAITANLGQFHAEQTAVGVDDDEKAYEAAIKNTVDPDTGDTVSSFTLSSPVGDLVNGHGEIATLGTVTYP